MAIVWPEELRQRKLSNPPNGNRTRNLPACSALPEPVVALAVIKHVISSV
jgi:hypothetical protein